MKEFDSLYWCHQWLQQHEFGDGEIIIEYGAFDCCINLKDIHFMFKPETKIVIDDEAFRNTPQQITFHVPAYKETFAGL